MPRKPIAVAMVMVALTGCGKEEKAPQGATSGAEHEVPQLPKEVPEVPQESPPLPTSPQESSGPPSPPETEPAQAWAWSDEERLWLGMKIYERAGGRGCGTCHDVRPFPDLTQSIQKLSKEEFLKVVREGRPGTVMAPMLPQIMRIGIVQKYCLTEEQALEALYRYLHALAEGKVKPGELKKPASLEEKAKACKVSA